jgi:hypothetical protein
VALTTVLVSRITKIHVVALHHVETEISIRNTLKEGAGRLFTVVEDEAGAASSITNLVPVIRITTVVVMMGDLDPGTAMIDEVTAVKMMIR